MFQHIFSSIFVMVAPTIEILYLHPYILTFCYLYLFSLLARKVKDEF